MYPTSDQNLSYQTDSEVRFFSHAFDPLNNWSAHRVQLWGKTFSSAEHAFHYRKFTETAPDVAEQILHAPSPWAAMQIERQHKDKRRKDWQDVKTGIMEEIVRAKVTQNDDVRACLLSTKNKTIIENSPWDNYWGIGEKGDGQNVLGKIYMKIRTELEEAK